MAYEKRGSRAVDESEDPKFIEVKLLRKYVPKYCYDVSEPNADTGERIATIVRNGEGKLIVQAEICLGEKDDKFGRKIPVYQENLSPVPPNTIISLPADEAKATLNSATRIALPTDRTFA